MRRSQNNRVKARSWARIKSLPPCFRQHQTTSKIHRHLRLRSNNNSNTLHHRCTDSTMPSSRGDRPYADQEQTVPRDPQGELSMAVSNRDKDEDNAGDKSIVTNAGESTSITKRKPSVAFERSRPRTPVRVPCIEQPRTGSIREMAEEKANDVSINQYLSIAQTNSPQPSFDSTPAGVEKRCRLLDMKRLELQALLELRRIQRLERSAAKATSTVVLPVAQAWIDDLKERESRKQMFRQRRDLDRANRNQVDASRLLEYHPQKLKFIPNFRPRSRPRERLFRKFWDFNPTPMYKVMDLYGVGIEVTDVVVSKATLRLALEFAQCGKYCPEPSNLRTSWTYAANEWDSTEEVAPNNLHLQLSVARNHDMGAISSRRRTL